MKCIYNDIRYELSLVELNFDRSSYMMKVKHSELDSIPHKFKWFISVIRSMRFVRDRSMCLIDQA